MDDRAISADVDDLEQLIERHQQQSSAALQQAVRDQITAHLNARDEEETGHRYRAAQHWAAVAAIVTAVIGGAVSGAVWYTNQVRETVREEERRKAETGRVDNLEHQMVDVQDDLTGLRRIHSLEAVREARTQAMIETLLRAQGQEPPKKTPREADAEQEIQGLLGDGQ